ncbi:MAG: hypothetical protein SGJ09_00585 [Phycisphaerae bacterium]|nr:hypothetical protein [Phycisphaerae bacterium]
MIRNPARAMLMVLLVAVSASGLGGCAAVRSDPEKATRQYPFWLVQGETIDAQVITDGASIVIVNATTREFTNADVWLNQRYLQHVESLAPGENLRLSMEDFWDVRGEGPNPGGIFRYYKPTPVRLVQLQIDETMPLVGLKAVLTTQEIQ